MNLKKVKLSVVLCTILIIGCSDKKSSSISYEYTKDSASIDNSYYFPPQLAITTLNSDPISKYQWHLINEGQHSGAENPGSIGQDLNIEDIWSEFRGRGIKVAVIDTGVELNHPDLNENIDLSLSYNYKTEKSDPTPTGSENEVAHGTACAGIIGAVGFNGIGVRGVAPEVSLIGLNTFANPSINSFASALFRSIDIDIYSNSWGESSISGDGISQSEMDAIEDGVRYGREGLGSIYIFASGNKRGKNHNGNYFEEQNSRYVISVGALSAKGDIATYSNPGANILISAYGGEDGYLNPAIVTTDTSGFNTGFDADYGMEFGQMNVEGNENGEYTHLMSGTSAATPMVAGVVALMLEAANKKANLLTYRDIKYILAKSARKNSSGSPSWKRNGANILVSHNFGYGVVDTKAAVEMAKTFESLGNEKVSPIYVATIDGTTQRSLESLINVSSNEVSHIEFVDVWVEMESDTPENLEIILTSPSGGESILQEVDAPLPRDFLKNWRFGSAMHLDESPVGKWRLQINNSETNESITLNSWRIRFYGH